jgi:hypothetical protein
VRAVLAAIVLSIAAAVPAQAQQQSTARVSASASVVMPVSVGASAVSVSETAGGVDVTRPLAVGGSVPWVLEVVEGASTDTNARRLTRDGRVFRAPAGQTKTEQPVTVRVPSQPATPAPAGAPRPVTYVVATIN